MGDNTKTTARIRRYQDDEGWVAEADSCGHSVLINYLKNEGKAIEHARDHACIPDERGCDHAQLAEWLQELKILRLTVNADRCKFPTRVYLDDERVAPEGWLQTGTVRDTINMLRTRLTTHLSLDNDLGPGIPEGYLVLDWLEEKVHEDPTFPVPHMTVHSQNSSRVSYMEAAIAAILRFAHDDQENISGIGNVDSSDALRR